MANRDFDRDWQDRDWRSDTDYDYDYDRSRSSDWNRGRDSGDWNRGRDYSESYRGRDFGDWNRGRNWGQQGTRPDLPWLRQDYFRNRGNFGNQGYGNYGQGRPYGGQGYRSSYGEDWERRGEYTGNRDWENRDWGNRDFGNRDFGRNRWGEDYESELGNRNQGYGSEYGGGYTPGSRNPWRNYEQGQWRENYRGRPWTREDYGWQGQGQSGRYGNYGWGGGFGSQTYDSGFGSQGGYDRGQWGQNRGRFSGMGPRNYQRSDERIREDINDRLTEHPEIDASDIDVQVNSGVVTLSGQVDDRWMKRSAEDIVESIPGVKDVRNEIKTNRSDRQTSQQFQTEGEGTRQAA